MIVRRLISPAARVSERDIMMHGLISRMRGPIGFDYVIVCTSNLSGEKYWQLRLEDTIQSVTGCASQVLVVHEDWDGGAGNGLGTLYAVVKAVALGRAKLGIELLDEMQAGKSVALYHTAGKGTRLAPLPAAENNNKPAVKLPELITLRGERVALTVLEAVIRQTSILAPRAAGRLATFWGDQIFVPSTLVGVDTAPTHHADILAALGPMPSPEEWRERGLHQYGLIATDTAGDALQLEKVTYEQAMEFLSPDVRFVGPSLGSFSLSVAALRGLLQEFKHELDQRSGQMDADPHFWMPTTLSEAAYVKVMSGKGTSAAVAKAHHKRMRDFRARLLAESPALRFFGAVNTGANMHWWDYGRLELYMENNILATQASASAKALRHFLGMTPRVQASDVGPVAVASGAAILGCSLRGGFVGPSSVLVNVKAPYVDVDNVVLVNVTSHRPIVGRHGCLYNVVDEDSDGVLGCDGGAVRADVFIPERVQALPRLGVATGRNLIVRSTLATDGGKAWKTEVEGNAYSFEDVYNINKDVDVTAAQEEAAQAHRHLAAHFTKPQV